MQCISRSSKGGRWHHRLVCSVLTSASLVYLPCNPGTCGILFLEAFDLRKEIMGRSSFELETS
jgi:hypothetical protein